MIEKPKKERRFLKALGRVGEILIQEVLIKIGSNLIKKIGGKKTLPSILFFLASLSLFAQYPATSNKQRLGYQTTGDGLVFRGRASDTTTIKSSGLNNAYFILDTVNNVLFNYIKTKGGWQFSNGDTIIINNNFTQPFDSLFFKTSVATNNVDTAKMRWDSDLGTVVLGMYDKVPNELGFKSFWLVKNQTGSTITKGSIVYANGTVGASGRITVAKFIANGSIESKYLLGITAHDLTNGEDGYVISFGKIRQVNTDTFAAGAILYPSPTVAGVWTDVEPVAPNIDMPIGFCINSHVNNGTIAIRVASGYKLSELHDVAISSPVDKASLYYTGGLWRDTTATLLVSDTASMLTNYLRTGVAAGTYLPLAGGTMTGTINRQEGSNDGSASTFYYNILNYFAKRDNNKGNQTAQITFTDRPGTSTFPNNVRTSDIYLMTAKNFSGGILGQYLDTTLSVVANQDGGRIGISKLNPAYKLDVNGTFNASGNSLIGGTLGVTGATTLGSTLAVTGATTLTGGINGNTKFNNGNVAIKTNHSSNWNSSQYSIIELGNGNTYNTIWGSSNGDGGANSYGQNGIGNNIDSDKYYGNGAASYLVQSGGRLSYWTSPNGSAGATRTDTKKLEIDANTLTINTATIFNNNLTVNSSAVFNEGSTNSDFRVESDGDANMIFVDASTDRVGIGTNAPTKTLEVNGTFNSTGDITEGGLNVLTSADTASLSSRIDGKVSLTGDETINGSKSFNNIVNFSNQITISGSVSGSNRLLGKNTSNNGVGDITIGTGLDLTGNNLTASGTDTASLSNRINLKYDKTGGTISGAVTLSTTTATPTALLGKDGSNVVGTVTTLEQTGLMKAGGTTTNTSSVGIITLAHGLSYTPSQVFVTLAQQSNYIAVCHAITSTDLSFTFYDSTTGIALNNVSVGFFWLAIK